MEAQLRRVAVVTGVARSNGIGRAVARRLVADGWGVVGCDVAAAAERLCEDDVLSASATEAFVFVEEADVALVGACAMSEAVLPLMPRDPSRAAIVHISSTRARQSEPNTEAYAAAKAGLLGLAHAQAVSLAGRCRVNTVLPGWIATDAVMAGAEPSEADHDFHPCGRVGLPDDVANAVAYLGDGRQSGFVTGTELVVDGGVSRKMIYPEDDE